MPLAGDLVSPELDRLRLVQQLRLITDSVPALISYVDAEGRYRYNNRAYEEWFGHGREEILGRRMWEVVGDAAFERIRQHVEAALAGRRVQYEMEVPYRDAGVRWIHADYVPDVAPQGAVAGFFALVTDMTRQKAAEEQAKAARDAAEQANSAKDRFLAVLSHELRTPLTPVLTAIQVIEEDKAFSSRHGDLLKVIRRNVQLEARLIDDLLDLTRISRGKLELFYSTLDLHEKIEHVCKIVASDARSKAQSLALDLQAAHHHVRGDGARVQQVLWNLLRNAIKFTPSGGSITVRTSNRPGQLRIEVSDTGCGIEPKSLASIFNAFEQGGRDVTRQFGGLGLGLAIARSLVEMHGGAIVAASEGADRGATFTVTLPLCEHPEAQADAPPGEAGDRRPRGSPPGRILFVDDHADTVRVMKRLLELDGHQVRTADSVARALAILGSDAVDLLISDIGLPDGSGLDLMRQVAAVHPIPAIALSGYGTEEDQQRSRKAGFAEHLTKPVDARHLQAVIERLLGGPAAPQGSRGTATIRPDRSETT